MASTQSSWNAGKYKNYKAKTEMPSSKDFQSFATDIVEKVIKKMKKTKNEELIYKKIILSLNHQNCKIFYQDSVHFMKE